MVEISNSDFSLIIGKLPIVIRYAKANIPADDTKAINAIRLLTIMQKKLKNKTNNYQNDKK